MILWAEIYRGWAPSHPQVDPTACSAHHQGHKVTQEIIDHPYKA
jgi:hypothetical protein